MEARVDEVAVARSYAGSSRVGSAGLEVTFKQNRQYIENLKKVVGAVSKKAYGEFIANALHRVVVETVKDSGRAAANWNVSFGGVMMTQAWDPEKYGQAYNGGPGSIGDRGDKGSGPASQVPYYKGFHYGYTVGRDGVQLVPNDKIYRALKIGEAGTPPAAYIYNPIFDPKFFRYANNAFKSGLSDSSVTVELDSKVAGSLPRLIRETAAEFKFPLTYKR